jgi:hypothetical protein
MTGEKKRKRKKRENCKELNGTGRSISWASEHGLIIGIWKQFYILAAFGSIFH